MEKEELVSVIVPVYNVEDYLPRCLETISKQTYQNLEIILVDDGSTDRSAALCDEFACQDKRAVVIHKHNEGLWAARNTGQRKAEGDYVIFVDADDYLHLEFIETMHDALIKNPQCDFAVVSHKNTHFLDEDVTVTGENVFVELTQDELKAKLFGSTAWTFSTNVMWNKLYRRELIADIWSRHFMREQDKDFNIRVYLKSKGAVWVRRELYFRLIRQGSLMRLPDDNKIRTLCVTQIYYQNLKELPAEKEQYRDWFLDRLYFSMIVLITHRLGADDEKEISQLCKEYENDTLKSYWKNKHTKLWKKIAVTGMLRFPYIARWLMKATNNF